MKRCGGDGRGCMGLWLGTGWRRGGVVNTRVGGEVVEVEED